jgi:hypothetical protein
VTFNLPVNFLLSAAAAAAAVGSVAAVLVVSYHLTLIEFLPLQQTIINRI